MQNDTVISPVKFHKKTDNKISCCERIKKFSDLLFWDKDQLIFGPSNPLFFDKKWPELPGASQWVERGQPGDMFAN